MHRKMITCIVVCTVCIDQWQYAFLYFQTYKMNLMHHRPITSMYMLHSRWIADWSVDGIHNTHDKVIRCRAFIQDPQHALKAVMIDNICSIAVAMALAALILAKLALAFALTAIA